MTVKLTYFRVGGKYYAEGSFTTRDDRELHHIWNDIQDMIKYKALPGLQPGSKTPWLVLVNVPGHKHEHPRLMMDERLRDFLIAEEERWED